MQFDLTLRLKAGGKKDARHMMAAILQLLEGAAIPALAVGDVKEHTGATVVYTDGGCDLKKNGLGAWAYVIDGEPPMENFGTEIETTNNRMEMMAVIEALEAVEIGPPIVVYSDSEYVVKGITVWCRNWVRNGWKTQAGKPVINQDLWQRLIALFQVHDVRFEHVKGHAGNPLNERCDQLCTAAMKAAHKEILVSNTVRKQAS